MNNVVLFHFITKDSEYVAISNLLFNPNLTNMFKISGAIFGESTDYEARKFLFPDVRR